MVLNLLEIVESGSNNLSKVVNLISYWFYFIYFFFFLGWGGVKGGISFLWIYWIYRMSWWKFYRICLVSEKVREKILTFLWNVWVSRKIIVVSRERGNFWWVKTQGKWHVTRKLVHSHPQAKPICWFFVV